MNKIFLVTSIEDESSVVFQELLELIATHYKREYVIRFECDIITEYDANSITLLYLSDAKIRTFIKNHLNSSMNIGFLPRKSNQKVQASYGISSDLHEALADALDRKNLEPTDILICNGEPVFTNIIIGDVHELNNATLEKLSFIKKIGQSVNNLMTLRFEDFTITTAKEQTIKTAATGVMVFEHNSKHTHSTIINEDISLHDGQLNALVLAPTSIISYLYYLFIVFIYNHFSIKKLPKSVGLIRTSKLNLVGKNPLDYRMDEMLLSSKSIEMEVVHNTLNISMGRKSSTGLQKRQKKESKESIKVQHLPHGEMRKLLIAQKIPFFKKAAEEDFKELFLSLRQSAKLSSVFLILMILSTLIATTGLFQSSSPVIIGAMILAPLMSPIVSLSMGVVRAQSELIINSMRTLSYGVLTALLFSCLYAYLMPLSHITNEIQARLNPNILDLMVAILSGIAGAYASAKSELSKSLAGVAIAVALVPPLSVTGIGIGWGDVGIIYGSFLLFITNFIGITLAAAITFIILGYAPIERAKKGLLYTGMVFVAVMIPLTLSFAKLIEQNRIATIISQNYTIHAKEVRVTLLDIDLHHSKPIIKLETLSQDVLNKNDFIQLKKELESSINQTIVLKIETHVMVP